MRVFTSIIPRRDGLVRAYANDHLYTFEAKDGSGFLSCDVENEEDANFLTSGDYFFTTPKVADFGDIPFYANADFEGGAPPVITPEEQAVPTSPTPALTRGRPRKTQAQ